MNNYIKNISNLEQNVTAANVEMVRIEPETPIVSIASIPPSVTGVDSERTKGPEVVDEADYMAPQKIKVRKYRLKK